MTLPNWYPDHPPIYDIHKSYLENGAEGPFFHGSLFPREEPKEWIDFLGFPLRSAIGIPAGPLLNSKWIALASRLGFDVLTYKTIRSEAHPSHPVPNVAFVDGKGNRLERPGSLDDLTITNSFGMPSRSPDFLLEDIAKANRSLIPGQVMIVSVVGSANRGRSFVQDFIAAAILAKEGGAKIIEANFSCPNVDKADGILYQAPETVHEYTRLIAKAIAPTPLILKCGLFENAHQMKSVLLAAARGGARGICGVNSISMQISPPLDEKRKTSGVCGGHIREKAILFIQEAAQIIRKNSLDLTLLGCGGIMRPEHFDLFFDAGAKIAMSATGMMWDPYLAMRYYERKTAHS